MPIINIIISFFLLFQFSLGNLDRLFNLPNIYNANALYSLEECGDGCRLIKFFIWTKCICPPKPTKKHTLNN